MTSNTDRMDLSTGFGVGFIEPAPTLSSRGFDPRTFFGKLVSGAKTFATAVVAAQNAAYLAERYYAMNNAQLARVGLTRDGIPAELLRVLDRN